MEETVEITPPPVKNSIGRNFWMVVFNGGMSTLGTAGFGLAIIWITLALTSSPVIAGFADGMGAAPLFLSFAFGAYIDGLTSKKNLAILVSVARALSILVLLIALESSSTLVIIAATYFVAFSIGLNSDILNSASASWTKQFLDDNQYKKGTSLIQSATSLAQSVGFVVAGALILFGFYMAIYGYAVIFALSTIPLILIKNDALEVSPVKSPLHSSMMQALSYIASSRSLIAIIITSLVVNLAFGTIGIFTAYLVSDKLGLPVIFFTTFFVLLTLGVFAGSVLGYKVKGKVGPYTVVTLLSIGILYMLFGRTSDIYLDFVVSFIIGILIGLVNVIAMTAILKVVQQELMARVMGAIKTFAVSLNFVSGALGGILIALISLDWGFYLIGGMIIVSTVIPFVFREYYNITI